jgi:hypothetical protein
LSIELTVPASVRSGRTGTVIVSYTNTSDNDIVAPLLTISSTNTSVSFSTPDDLNDYVQTAQILATAAAKKETVLVLQFSGALNASAADNLGAYELAAGGPLEPATC